MSEMRSLLVDTATRLFDDHCTRTVVEAAEHGTWPAALWNALDETGLSGASRSEARGGAGASMADVFALVGLAGSKAVPAPLAETLLAEEMLAAADLPPLDGPLTIAPVLRRDRLALRKSGGEWIVSGTLHRVPWARDAQALVAIAESADGARTIVVRPGKGIEHDWNYAREPRDTVRLDDLRIDSTAVGANNHGYTREQLYFRGALYRVVAMAGAISTLLELTVRYAKERTQFGRPIGKYQAVQQQIAALASQAAAAVAVSHAAAEAAVEGPGHFEIAAAKARIGEAVASAAGIAHQVHAAMGFTHEHTLHRSTRRLWTWRDEFGTENEWAAWVGATVAHIGGEDLWAFLTQQQKPASPVPLPE